MNTSTSEAPESILRVISGVDGHTVLFTASEAPLYQLHVTRFFTDYQPVTQTECELVGRLALTEWRLNRLARIEVGLFAAGHLQFDHLFADQDLNVRDLLVDHHTSQVYGRQLKELSLQESRLRRYFYKDEERYLALQKARLEQTQDKIDSSLSAPRAIAMPAPTQPGSFRTASSEINPNGFEFSSVALPTTRDEKFRVQPIGPARKAA